MKNFKIFIGSLLLLTGVAGCSSAYYRAEGNAYDDLYGSHNKTAIARKQQAQAEAQKAAAEARKAEWEARLAEARAQAAEDAYYGGSGNLATDIVADDYESAYARRLRGFQSPTYRMPSSYYELRYTNFAELSFATAYDPAFYNVMVSGDQVWVEPKYITSMFGSWGATPYYGGWYFGWNSGPSYAWWGYPRYSWWDWNWSVAYNPWYNPWYYNPWYGYYPHHHYYPGHGHGGGGGGRPHAPNIVHRPGYTSPNSGRSYGSRDGGGFNRGASSSFGVRGSQGNRFNSSSNSSSGSSFNRGGSAGSRNDNNSGVRNGRGGTTTFNRGSGSSGSSSSFNRGSSSSGSNTSYTPGSSSSGSSFGGSSSGSSSSGRNIGGRNAGGR